MRPKPQPTDRPGRLSINAPPMRHCARTRSPEVGQGPRVQGMIARGRALLCANDGAAKPSLNSRRRGRKVVMNLGENPPRSDLIPCAPNRRPFA